MGAKTGSGEGEPVGKDKINPIILLQEELVRSPRQAQAQALALASIGDSPDIIAMNIGELRAMVATALSRARDEGRLQSREELQSIGDPAIEG